MREVLEPYDRLGVPRVRHEFSTSRLLVLDYIEGVGVARSSDSPERREAARQLLESFYRQLLADGFFHADPHPGNLLWSEAEGKIYLLDLGMVGELGPELRELMTLLLLAFSRNDARFLSEAVLMLSGEKTTADLDLDALERDFAAFVERFQVTSLRDIQIGAMLEGMMQIASRHGVRLPASLALSGKAFGQIQLAIAELDPTLDPFKVASDFLLRDVARRLCPRLRPALARTTRARSCASGSCGSSSRSSARPAHGPGAKPADRPRCGTTEIEAGDRPRRAAASPWRGRRARRGIAGGCAS